MGYTEVGGLTPFHDGQTMKVAEAGGLTTLYGGQTTRDLSALSIFSRNRILSVFSVLRQLLRTLSIFSRITGALSDSREGDYSQYFRGRQKLSVFDNVSVVTQHTLRYSNLN
jgi:hypothetical protein